LIHYEGDNYKMIDCFVSIGNRPEPVAASVFVWQGYEEDLEDGTFDPSIFSDDLNCITESNLRRMRKRG